MCVTQKDLYLPVSRSRSQRASGSVRTICIVIRQSGLRTSLRSTTWAWSCHQWSHLSAPQSPPPPSSLCLRCTWWVQLWQPIIRTSSAYFLLWQSLWWGLEPHSIERWLKCMRSVVTAGVGSNIEMFRSLLWWLSQQWANPGYWNANIWALLAHVWGANINQELEKTFSGIKLSLSSSSTTHLLTFDNFIRWTLTETKETKKDNSRL